MLQIFFEVYLLLSDIYCPYTILAVKFKISPYVSVMFTICVSHYRNAINRKKNNKNPAPRNTLVLVCVIYLKIGINILTMIPSGCFGP